MMLFRFLAAGCLLCVVNTQPICLSAQTDIPGTPIAAPTSHDKPDRETTSDAKPVSPTEPIVADLKLTRVALHTSGKGYFEYHGEVGEAAIFSLPIRSDEVSDLIRSATIVDPAQASFVRLPVASDPIVPVPAAIQTQTRGDLLTSMRGQRVTIQDRSGLAVKGRLITVELRAEIVDRVAIDRELVSVLTDEGIVSLPLEDIEQIAVEDPVFRERLNRSLEALAEPNGTQNTNVEFVFRKAERRSVTVVVIREVPIWKATYFADLEGLKLRTVVENTTDLDWTNVHLTLATGNPMAFDMDVTSIERPQRVKVDRPQPQAKVVGGLDESLDWVSGSRKLAEVQHRANDSAQQAGSPVVSLTDKVANSKPSAVTDAGAAGAAMFVQFKNIDVPAGKNVLLDLAIKPTEIGIVSVYRPRDPDPRLIMCLEIENLQPFQLPSGPATIFLKETGYAGEAIMPTLNPNVKRLVPFAVDQSVRVIRQVSPPERDLVSLEIDQEQRTVRWVYRTRIRTNYHIDNRDAKGRAVLIEHPLPPPPIEIVRSSDDDPSKDDIDDKTKQDDATQPDPDAERTSEVVRYESLVLPGQARTRFVIEQAEYEGSVSFLSLGDSRIASWLEDESVDAATNAKLLEIIALRTKHQQTRKSLRAAEQQRGELASEIKRVSEQLRIQEKVELPATLKTRYQNRLVELEDQRDALTTRQSELQESLDKQATEIGVTPGEANDLF